MALRPGLDEVAKGGREQAGDEACVSRTGDGQARRLRQVAGREHDPYDGSGSELAAAWQLAEDQGQSKQRQREANLQKRQRRVVCDCVLDQDEGPTPNGCDHQQQKDVDQWSDSGRRGECNTSASSRSQVACSAGSSRTPTTTKATSFCGGRRARS